ncbi:RUN and FYVE domain-containing protein 1 [Phytophthora citrophthora]|uniref:RUN and FYVE domain-containing protein 1 n=1 Tax=Phytophthora citrophthora TaxID=4793 RepID=A0AAD9GPF5_9STRA|nr:RUN and FYVE domain-containing protein 1 [Phytophthora citrophthora]
MNHGYANNHAGFPLRSDFFRSLPLAKFKNDKLYRLAKANALASLNQSFNDQWRYVPPEKDGTQIRKDTSNMSVSYRLVRAATVLRCQEHEVNQVIANTNSESWREFMRKCFGKYYVDTLILHNVMKPMDVNESSMSTGNSSVDGGQQQDRATRSNSQPEGSGSGENADNNAENDQCEGEGRRASVWDKGAGQNDSCQHRNSETSSVDTPSGKLTSECGSSNTEERLKEEAAAAADGLGEQAEEMLTVKWAAFETGLSGKRDVCLVDYLSLAYVPNSEPRERVHVWCFTSADGDRVGCMGLKDTHHVERTTLTKLGVFWRKVSEDETEVIVCGSFPSKHAPMVSAILLSCLNKLQGIVEDLRMSSQLYIQRATWVKNNERTTCNLCTRNFHALRRKHHCRRCGEVVCSDCSTVETIDLPAIGYSKLRLCKVCSIRARTTPLKRLAKTNVFDHLVRARSLSNVGLPGSSSSFTRSSYTENNQTNHEDSYSHSTTSDLVPPYGASQSSFAGSGNDNNNNVDGPVTSSGESFNEYTISTNTPETSDSPIDINEVTAVVHPMTTCLGTPTEEYDDFIDERCLKTQLCAMEQKKRSTGSNSNMFDLLCELACQTLNCPIASVSIIDDKDNFIRSAVGVDEKSGLDSELSIFIEKIMGSTPTIVLDASVDKQALKFFSLRSLPAIRFFAGCPIYSRTGKKLGYVCVADFAKRDTLGASCAFTMERLATLAVTTMERNIVIKNNSSANGSNNSTEEADFTKRAPPPTPMHPAMLFDRPNSSGSTTRGNNNGKENSAQSEALVGRVYEIVEDEMPPMATPSTVNLNQTANSTRPGERSAGYYEAQERMRKLLLKSYHTQQQLATGGSQ